jgi:uncharacterized delta-60 repeat protein
MKFYNKNFLILFFVTLLSIFQLSRCGSGVCPMGAAGRTCSIGANGGPTCKADIINRLNCASGTTVGVLDTAFNSTGSQTYVYGATPSPTHNLATSADCKFLFPFLDGAASQIKVLKLNADSSLDTTFGTAGTLSMGASSTYFFGIFNSNNDTLYALQQSPGSNYIIRKYLPSGSIDSTYGTAGTATISGAGYTACTGYALDSLGQFYLLFDQKYIKRANAAGALDTTFGTAGTATTGLTTMAASYRVGLALDSSQRIYVGGAGGTNMRIERLTSTGQIDTTFATAGGNTRVITTGDGNSYIANVKLDCDGNVYVAGMNSQNMGYSGGYFVVKYNENGIVDTTFGVNGQANNFGASAVGRHVANPTGFFIDRITGKLTLGSIASSFGNIAVARLNANGSADTTFGAGTGSISTTFYNNGLIHVLPNGKVMTYGSDNAITLFTSVYR